MFSFELDPETDVLSRYPQVKKMGKTKFHKFSAYQAVRVKEADIAEIKKFLTKVMSDRSYRESLNFVKKQPRVGLSSIEISLSKKTNKIQLSARVTARDADIDSQVNVSIAASMLNVSVGSSVAQEGVIKLLDFKDILDGSGLKEGEDKDIFIEITRSKEIDNLIKDSSTKRTFHIEPSVERKTTDYLFESSFALRPYECGVDFKVLDLDNNGLSFCK